MSRELRCERCGALGAEEVYVLTSSVRARAVNCALCKAALIEALRTTPGVRAVTEMRAGRGGAA